MKKTILAICALYAFLTHASIDSTKLPQLENRIDALEMEMQVLKQHTQQSLIWVDKKFNDYRSDNNRLIQQQDSVFLSANNSIIANVEEAGQKIDTNASKLNTVESKLIDSLSSFSQALLASIVILLLLIAFLFYRLINLKSKTVSIQQKASELESRLEHEVSVASDNLLKAIQSIKVNTGPNADNDNHTIVLEFADQIVKMENTLYNMDPTQRGYKHIKRSLDKMHDTLQTMNYEVSRLLGSKIVEGQIIEIKDRKTDETIESEDLIVFTVNKSEVFYKGKQIQRAEVGVKYNPNYID